MPFAGNEACFSGKNIDSWRKSTRCGHESQCVEVAQASGQASGSVAVRDSKSGAQILLVGRAGWRAFVADAKSGRFDSA